MARRIADVGDLWGEMKEKDLGFRFAICVNRHPRSSRSYTASALHFFSRLFPWGLILQAIALVHFINGGPDGVWLWIIIFLGPLGALVYIGIEMVPDLGLLRQSFDTFGRRKRIRASRGGRPGEPVGRQLRGARRFVPGRQEVREGA